ncbi:MAG: hypothetical protein HY908_35630 [Myxococcales bacterium]|nr:hypothetical protein [Myxococcales bacterium]
MRLAKLLAFASLPVLAATVYAAGCDATGKSSRLGPDGTGGTGTGGGTGNNPAGGAGGFILTTSSTSAGGSGGSIVNPCGSACGPTELCDPAHLGTDDDCNGTVDEGCPCQAGASHWCFAGDASFLNQPGSGCFPGTMSCSELGTWGECFGGVPVGECGGGEPLGCHAITSPPLATANLQAGAGNFYDPGALSNVWTVACPAGVSPCPVPNGPSFVPLVSGEYMVTYTKTTANGPESCDYPLFVGAPGLRVELSWDHPAGSSGADLDLHMHEPGTTTPWSYGGSNTADCGYGNCTVEMYTLPFPLPTPQWFNGAAPPDPVNWYKDPDYNKNTCYFAPWGRGQQWVSFDQGCHNPRLDLDNIVCDPAVSDPTNSSFCAPENINVDFPPNDVWTRIGVHYYSSHSENYSVRPHVRIFCNARLAGELGQAGYANSPIVWTPADGASPSSNKYWLVADVRFSSGGECAVQSCEVAPLYLDPNAHTAYVTTTPVVEGSWAPPYPP